MKWIFCQIVGVEIFEIESDVLTEKNYGIFLSNCRYRIFVTEYDGLMEKIKEYFSVKLSVSKLFEMESDVLTGKNWGTFLVKLNVSKLL